MGSKDGDWDLSEIVYADVEVGETSDHYCAVIHLAARTFHFRVNNPDTDVGEVVAKVRECFGAILDEWEGKYRRVR